MFSGTKEQPSQEPCLHFPYLPRSLCFHAPSPAQRLTNLCHGRGKEHSELFHLVTGICQWGNWPMREEASMRQAPGASWGGSMLTLWQTVCLELRLQDHLYKQRGWTSGEKNTRGHSITSQGTMTIPRQVPHRSSPDEVGLESDGPTVHFQAH